MASRYIRQFEFTNAVTLPECPVALEKGAVLLDAKTNTYQLQLKLANIGQEGVNAARVYIEALDGEGNTAYTGLYGEFSEYAEAGAAFGTKRLIPLPFGGAVSFRVYVEEITLEDDRTLTFDRSQYIISPETRDLADLRERAFQTAQAERERQAKITRTMWGAWWYHLLLALTVVLTFLTPLPLISRFLFIAHFFAFPALWIFPWIRAGSPDILKRAAIAALVTWGLHVLLLIGFLFSRNAGSYFGVFLAHMIVRCAVGVLPFLGIYLNVRRFNPALSFGRSLFFWMGPAPENAPVQAPAKKEPKKMPARYCGSCGSSLPDNAKFCGKCGAKVE